MPTNHVQRRATRRLRALERLRAELGLDAWPLNVAARNVVEQRWARYVGLQVYRAAAIGCAESGVARPGRSRRRRQTSRRRHL